MRVVFLQEREMTVEEQLAVYLKMPRKDVALMLIECNKHLKDVPPRFYIHEDKLLTRAGTPEKLNSVAMGSPTVTEVKLPGGINYDDVYYLNRVMRIIAMRYSATPESKNAILNWLGYRPSEMENSMPLQLVISIDGSLTDIVKGDWVHRDKEGKLRIFMSRGTIERFLEDQGNG